MTEGGVVVIKDYNYFFCSCFEESLYSSGYLKEGVQATVQGKLSPYKTDEGNFSVSIIVERIDTIRSTNNITVLKKDDRLFFIPFDLGHCLSFGGSHVRNMHPSFHFVYFFLILMRDFHLLAHHIGLF